MLSFHTAASVAASPDFTADGHLQHLLKERVQLWSASGVLDHTHLVVVQPGDLEDAIQEEIGLSLLVSPLDGQRFGSPGFHPFWDWLQDHGGWFELIVSVGNDGFAYVLFIPDQPGVPQALLALCRTYATRRSNAAKLNQQ